MGIRTHDTRTRVEGVGRFAMLAPDHTTVTAESVASETAERTLHEAFESGDRAQCVQLIGSLVRPWLKAGEIGNVLRWTGRLSRKEILEHESIATTYIAIMIFRRRFAEATAWLREAEASLTPPATAAHARLRTLRLMLGVISERADEHLLEEVGDGPTDRYLTGALIALQAYALLRKNRFDAAKRRALRAKELMAEHGDAYGASYADVLVSLAQRLSGDLVGSAQTCERLYASLAYGAHNPAWVNAASALAHLRYEQNRLSEARAICDELFLALPIASTPENLASVYVTSARVALAEGNAHEAARLLDYLHSAVEDGRHTRLIAVAVYERVRLALLVNDSDAAQRIVNEAGLNAATWSRPRAYEPGWDRLGQAYATLLLHQREVDAARAVLQTLIKSALHVGCIVRVIGLEALLASCEWLAGDRAQSFALVDRALSRTRAVGFTRSVFDEAPEFATVLSAAIAEHKLSHSLPNDYERRWAEMLAAHSPSTGSAGAPIESLTDRERDVLRLVSLGLRNEEISGRLKIAVSTTKWHLKNIFAKLRVACRTEALVRAKQLRLLE